MRIVAAAIALSGALTAASAHAQQSARVCMPDAETLVDQLGKEYGEVLTGGGVDSDGNLVQVYSSDAKGTWTVAITIPGGPTCVVSSGSGWSYTLPYDERLARQLYEAGQQAEAEGGTVRLRMGDGTEGGEAPAAEWEPPPPSPPKG